MSSTTRNRLHDTRLRGSAPQARVIQPLPRDRTHEKPHIVHTHTPKAGTLGMLAARFAGVPHRLHTIAGLPLLETQGLKRKLLNTVEKLTYACSTLILPNSFAMQDIVLEEKFCKKEKLRVIGNGSSNGIDTDHYNKKKVTLVIYVLL